MSWEENRLRGGCLDGHQPHVLAGARNVMKPSVAVPPCGGGRSHASVISTLPVGPAKQSAGNTYRAMAASRTARYLDAKACHELCHDGP